VICKIPAEKEAAPDIFLALPYFDAIIIANGYRRDSV